MNSIYRRGYLLPGDWDGEQVNFSMRQFLLNNYVSFSMLVVSFIHILLGISNDQFLLKELIFFKITDGNGMRVCNIAVGLCVGSMSNFLLNHRHLRTNPKSFRCFNFLFCLGTVFC